MKVGLSTPNWSADWPEVAARIELQTVERLQVQAQANGACGVAGLEVELETLAPVTNAVGFGTAATDVASLLIQIAVEKGDVGVAVIDEVGMGGHHDARQGGPHQGTKQLVHGFGSWSRN